MKIYIDRDERFPHYHFYPTDEYDDTYCRDVNGKLYSWITEAEISKEEYDRLNLVRRQEEILQERLEVLESNNRHRM